jgi:hypothetical protein
MILVRDIFRAKLGRDKEAHQTVKEGIAIIHRLSHEKDGPRLLVEFASQFHTFTLESPYESLADYERALATLMADAEYLRWFERVIPLMDGVHREFHAVVE